MALKGCLPAVILSCSAAITPDATAAIVDMGDAGKLEFKADAFVKGYHVDHNEPSVAMGRSLGSVHGSQSRVRLTLNMSNNSGWSMNSRFKGYYDWAGDRRHSGGSGSDYTSGSNSDSLTLDVAYLEYTGIESWAFRIGRQKASWGLGFSVGDDRRDRFLAAKTIMLDKGYVALLGFYDLRFAQEHSENLLTPVSGGDLSTYNIGAVGKYNDLDWGLLAGYFDGKKASATTIPNPYFMNDLYLIAPYFSKTFDKVSLKGAANFVISDINKDNRIYFWGNNSQSAFIEGGYQLTPEFQLQAQASIFVDGGLIGRSWDSYSMLINNNPRNEVNPAYTELFGGFGNVNANFGEDGLLYALRANWNVTEALRLTFATGHMDVDLYNADLYDDKIESTFFDIKALYEFSSGNSLEFRAGHADGDIDATSFLTTLRVNFG